MILSIQKFAMVLKIFLKPSLLRLATISILWAPALSASTSSSESTDRPNILFIFADDWGFGDLGCHGHNSIETPHLDRLASQGTDFQQSTMASGVCSPSRAALLTGHFPSRYLIEQHFATVRHHVRADMPDWLDPQAPMLPRQLQQSGYATYHFGKWHLTGRSITDAPHPTEYGYDRSTVWNGPDPSVDPHEIFDLAIDVIKEADEKPFFINLWLNETHTPHIPTDEWLDYYAAKGLNKRDRVYPAVVSNADEQIGRILEALEQEGLSDNTLVIFTSDNGPEVSYASKPRVMNHPELGEGLNTWYSLGSSGGLKGAKRSLHEGGIRVPLIVRWPGRVQEGVIDKTSVITGVDWLPTLCQLVGAEVPDGYEGDGEDRSQVLLGHPSERSKPIFWRWQVASRGENWAYAAIRHGKWKLLMGRDGARLELYDIPADRSEINDLADKHPAVLKELQGKLVQWLEELPEIPSSDCLSKLRQ